VAIARAPDVVVHIISTQGDKVFHLVAVIRYWPYFRILFLVLSFKLARFQRAIRLFNFPTPHTLGPADIEEIGLTKSHNF
jgi:hypothetical protein